MKFTFFAMFSFAGRLNTRLTATITILVICACGCYLIEQPTGPQNWTLLCANEIPTLGDAIINSSLCRNADGPILLKIGNMLDKTRFAVDADLLMKKMRTHLVNNGGGRISVFDNDSDVAAFCQMRQKKRMHDALKSELKYIAMRIVRSSTFRGKCIKMAAMPIEGCGVDVRGNTGELISLLRDEIVAMGSGRFTFVTQDRSQTADYVLKSQLTSFDVNSVSSATKDRDDNADMNLRITFERPQSLGVPCFEISMPVRKKLFSSSLDATFVLSGELNVLTKETPNSTDDYVRMGFNIVDPDTMLHKWEGACEVSVTTHKSVLYQ